MADCSEQIKLLASYLTVSLKTKSRGNVVFAEAGLCSDIREKSVCLNCRFSLENIDKSELNLKDICRRHLSASPSCNVALERFKASRARQTVDQVKIKLHKLADTFNKEKETSVNGLCNGKDVQHYLSPNEAAAQTEFKRSFIFQTKQFDENLEEEKLLGASCAIPKLKNEVFNLNGLTTFVNPSAKYISDQDCLSEASAKTPDEKVPNEPVIIQESKPWMDGNIDSEACAAAGFSLQNGTEDYKFLETVKPTAVPRKQDHPAQSYQESFDLRLKTFIKWPTNSPVRPKDLAEAGFVYTGKGDNTKCVFCSGVLCDWEPGDEPEVEHRKHFPLCKRKSSKKCVFIEYDSRITNGGASCSSRLDSGTKFVWNSQMTSKEIEKKVQSLREENQTLRERRLCKLCLDRDIDTVFLPCGHLVSCKECAPKISKCAICRTIIRGTVLAFIPLD